MREPSKTLAQRPPGAPDGLGKTATLRDVAREAGVSPATASRALNGSTRNVRQENIDRVLAAAAKLRYEPHLSAQAFARGTTATAALVVRGIDDPYFSSIAAGAVQRAEDEDLIVTMAVADRTAEGELEIVRTLRGQRPRTIILAGSRIDGSNVRDALIEELQAYRKGGGTVVVVSQPGLPFSTVSVDNSGGAGQLGRALAQQGYRRFAVLRGSTTLWTSRERYQGFVAGTRSAGVDIAERFVVDAEFTRAGGYAAANELLDRGLEDTELIFAVNDVMAIGAMTALRDAGIVPGRDLAIAGFDDIAAAMDVDPELTSVSVPLHQIGWTAMNLAISEEAEPRVIQIPTEVKLRHSTPTLPPAR